MIRRLLTVLGDDAGPLRRVLAGLVVGGVLQGIALALLVPVLRHLVEGDTAAATRWVLAEVALVAVYAVVHYRTQMDAYLSAVALGRRQYHRVGDHLASLPLGWFTSERAGHVGRLTSTGIVDVMGVPAHLLRPMVYALVTPLTVALVMVAFDWRLGLAGLLAAPVLAVVYRWSGGLIERSDHHAEAAAVRSADRLVEFAEAQPVLRAFGAGADGSGALDDALVAQRRADRRLLWHAAGGVVAFSFTVQLAFTAALLVGIDLALGGTLDAAEAVALLVLLTRAVEPLQQLSELGGSMRLARNNLTRLDELLAAPPLPEPGVSARPADGLDGSVELDGVTFGYDPAHPVLADVSFTVPAGTTTAVVGPSGAGKTTLARLVGRFWDVTAGAVRVGGADVRDLRTEDLMAQLAFVFQDVYLFDGTIEENVRTARPGASDADVADALRRAQLDEVVARLPDGLATRVGEGGTSLSGGERQRVSIARALLKDAPIVLLDEPSAALDTENDARLQAALHELGRRRTLLVIAHRLGTVVDADQIVVLQGGRVVERGTHDTLLAAGGAYAATWQERSRAAGWRLRTLPT